MPVRLTGQSLIGMRRARYLCIVPLVVVGAGLVLEEGEACRGALPARPAEPADLHAQLVVVTTALLCR